MLKNRNDVTVGREVNSSAMTQTVARKGHVKQKGVHTEKMIMSITPPLSTTGRFADVLRKGQRSQTWLWLVVYEINKNFLPEVVTLDAGFTIMSLYHHIVVFVVDVIVVPLQSPLEIIPTVVCVYSLFVVPILVAGAMLSENN